MKTKLFFAGDVVVAEGCAQKDMFSERLREKLQDCKVVCCNFEAPIAKGLSKKKKVGPNNANAAETVYLLAGAGFNLATLANNHIFDFDIAGIKQTVSALHQCNIGTIGAGTSRDEITSPYIVKNGDVKIGIVNMAENGFGCSVDKEDSYGYAYIFDPEIRLRIKSLREQCDAVVVVCHAGAEMWDIPLPEWRAAYKNIIDSGADAVVAHHPHVPQGYEEYKGKPIFYSLGNFAFDKGTGAKKPESYCVILTVEGNGLTYEVVPTVFKDGIVDINRCETFGKHLEQCCAILKDDNRYMQEVNRKCLEEYSVCQKNYGKVTCNYMGSIKEWAKGFVKKHIFRIKFQDIWLYHNTAIETHLYICKRASRLLLKRKNIL